MKGFGNLSSETGLLKGLLPFSTVEVLQGFGAWALALADGASIWGRMAMGPGPNMGFALETLRSGGMLRVFGVRS